MLLKERTEPHDLVVLRYLNNRMELSAKDQFQLSTLEKGYAGEVMFDQKTEHLSEERYIIDDLLLQVNNSFFQLDKVIIARDAIHLIDVKNFVGDFYLDGDKLYAVKNGREYKNPITQLTRSATLFRQLLQNLKLNHIVHATTIFINPEFTLYQAPMDQPIILPTQTNRYIKELQNTPSKLEHSHQILAQKLLSLHQVKNPFSNLPDYDYEQLEKGIYCKNCYSFNTYVQKFDLVCGKCGTHEKIGDAVLRTTEEFKLLFPEYRITSANIYKWANSTFSNKTISRVLQKNFAAIGKNRHTYYE
ncbi:nuclease-related domain-containing protein [Mesobacillus subterraneus]|uniref:NERD domain-containing protein n=1 Tax=Mesobacillus subterraneus TaxID=285983 RepID=A0A3R9FD46_9BACI|nr:nuclease-related domain-containing protein [Mesobacillus subterraneus]RSD22320.1 NERD domain-containing protein [Mesobacillus subterraneus]